jgi:tetratricopeptide (TPR) repeat protein
MQFKEWNGLAENLGRFRLSLSSDPAALNRERKRFAALKLTDPWAKLAAAYHLLGDKKALDTLVKHHPKAAFGIGDLYAAAGDWERAMAEYRKFVTDQPTDDSLLTRLATAYQSAGRTRELVPLLAKASAANPKDTLLSLRVAAFQAWFAQEKELAATRQRILAFARDTNEWMTAERAAKACSILPSTDKAELDTVLALGRAGEQLAESREGQEWRLMALGMAEYRSGNHAAADQALVACDRANPKNPWTPGIAGFYRALNLFRQGKPVQARKLAIRATAKMRPLPNDEKNPLTGEINHDDLILWLAYKEARALIKFETPPPPKGKDGKK